MAKSSTRLVFRSAYDGRNLEVSDRTATPVATLRHDCNDIENVRQDIRTKQAFKHECDINNIMAKYRVDGFVRVSNKYARGEYRDLSNAPTFHAAMNIVLKGKEAFDALPAALRKRFDNDPESFLAFATDPNNRKEMIELGLAEQRKVSVEAAAAADDRRGVAPAAPASAAPITQADALGAGKAPGPAQ